MIRKMYLKYITKKIGLGSEFEGYIKVYSEGMLLKRRAKQSKMVHQEMFITIDTLTIEYPDDWKHEY